MLKVSATVLASIQRGLLARKVNPDNSGFIVVRQIAANKIKMSLIWVTVVMTVSSDTSYYLSQCRKTFSQIEHKYMILLLKTLFLRETKNWYPFHI